VDREKRSPGAITIGSTGGGGPAACPGAASYLLRTRTTSPSQDRARGSSSRPGNRSSGRDR